MESFVPEPFRLLVDRPRDSHRRRFVGRLSEPGKGRHRHAENSADRMAYRIFVPIGLVHIVSVDKCRRIFHQERVNSSCKEAASMSVRDLIEAAIGFLLNMSIKRKFLDKVKKIQVDFIDLWLYNR